MISKRLLIELKEIVKKEFKLDLSDQEIIEFGQSLIKSQQILIDLYLEKPISQ